MKGLTEHQILKVGTLVRMGQDEYIVMGDDRETSEDDLSDLNYYLLEAGKTPAFDAWYDVMTIWTDIEAVLCSCCNQWRPLEEMQTVTEDERVYCLHCEDERE